MNQPLAYLNGRFVPAAQATIPAYDAGFVLGVTVAEQLRTFGGQLFRLERHLERLGRSLAIVGVDPGCSLAELGAAARELVAKNHPFLAAGDDLGLSIFVTPGPYATLAPRGAVGPTVGMHTYPLPFSLWSQLYDQGQSLIVSDVRQVPAECWPRELKCRSRMHYYLADHQARSVEQGARALLLDLDGHVAEASTANLLIYRSNEGLVSPPRERILPGISMAVLEELAAGLSIPFLHCDLTVADVAAADEAMLCSTSPCVWPCVRLDGRPIGSGAPGPIARRLLAAWSELVGLDIAEQARRFSHRNSVGGV